jgi:hypothetical protein
MLTVIVLGLAAVLAAVFLAPLDLQVWIAKAADEPRAVARVRVRYWGFPLEREWPAHEAEETGPKRSAERRASPRRRAFGWKSVRAALITPGFVRRCLWLGRDLLRLTRPDEVRVRGRIGLDDPADTGMWLGWLYGLNPLVRDHADVRIEPDFGGPVIEGTAEGRWRRRPAGLLGPLVRFLASPVVWRAALAARRAAVR